MSLFDRLVDTAIGSLPEFVALRAVVEKELLHHDILREMAAADLLVGLTFIGGTCLRACYGASRLSEDLDFAGGANFSRDQLVNLGHTLEQRLQAKYGLTVSVSEPSREGGNVDTWKMKIVTRPERPDLPMQRINLDICAVPSHDPRPMMLRNHYNVDMGTSGLILQAESREEILADKIVALALRPNRVKNRDLWDIGWLVQQGVRLPQALIPLKLVDHRCEQDDFVEALRQRVDALVSEPAMYDAFRSEMRRFLPLGPVLKTVDNPDFWHYITARIQELSENAITSLSSGNGVAPTFQM